VLPAEPRWLLTLPDAIQQLEALDRELLTRRDLEHLFGMSRARAAVIMGAFGAGRIGECAYPAENAAAASITVQGVWRSVGKLFALAQALTNDYERFESSSESVQTPAFPEG
jgi:hypothetical protein